MTLSLGNSKTGDDHDEVCNFIAEKVYAAEVIRGAEWRANATNWNVATIQVVNIGSGPFITIFNHLLRFRPRFSMILTLYCDSDPNTNERLIAVTFRLTKISLIEHMSNTTTCTKFFVLNRSYNLLNSNCILKLKKCI